jgi:predicted AAA+ superfamily ATPase
VINFLDDHTLQTYLAHPDRLRQVVNAHPNVRDFVIDEVQLAPAVLNTAHLLIEEKRNIRFVFTGSSARKLKRSGVNLLAGRAILSHFHPFMAGEMGNQFSLERALAEGLVPLIVQSATPKDTLAAYISLYIKEEVYSEGLVRRLDHFTRFLEAAALSHTTVLNLNNIAREAQISRKMAENYISILEDLLLGFRLPVFSLRAKRETIYHTKFFLFDAGVFRYLRPRGPLDIATELDGAALEGLVAQHLRAWIDYSRQDSTLFFWRTRSGLEVDFVVYGDNRFWAIEVKNSATIHPQDLRGLAAFGEDYPESERLLLYRGTDTLLINGIRCQPVSEFLLGLRPGK